MLLNNFIHPVTGQESTEKEERKSPNLSLTSALYGGVWNATLRPLYPWERDLVFISRRLIGPRAVLEGCRGSVQK
jgi:hypothetical protein